MDPAKKLEFETFLSEKLEQPQFKISLIVDYVENLIGITENLKILESKKQNLYRKLYTYKKLNDGKYPRELYSEFFKYWAEESKNGKKIRYDDEKFFDIGRRLATFAKIAGPEKLSRMWEEQKKNERQQVKQTELL